MPYRKNTNPNEQYLKQEGGFTYLEHGEGEPLLLLHGLFGALSNWTDVVRTFAQDRRVLIPVMPIYIESDYPSTPDGLANFIGDFIDMKKLDGLTLIGNSLGGHVGLVYTLKHPEKVARLVLTGSSGLFEAGMGSGLPRRGDYAYIKERVEFTFYSPKTATQALVDEVFELVNDPKKAMGILKIARSAQRMNMREDIQHIQIPTCLIWGLNDTLLRPM